MHPVTPLMLALWTAAQAPAGAILPPDDAPPPAPPPAAEQPAATPEEQPPKTAAPVVPAESGAPLNVGALFKAAFVGVPWWKGLHVDGLAGMAAFPSSADKWRSNMDRLVGVRVGWRRTIWKLGVGTEFTWRSTAFVPTGTLPFVPQALVGRISGDTPQQVIRQQNMAALGLVLGFPLQKLEWFVEPHATAGLSLSHHTVMVTLDSWLPYNRSFMTLGAYAGAGFTTGLEPVYARFDVMMNYQVGRPPFTVQIPQASVTTALGVRL